MSATLARPAAANLTILEPSNSQIFTVDCAPGEPCSVRPDLRIEVSGTVASDPATIPRTIAVESDHQSNDTLDTSHFVCEPDSGPSDPFEPSGNCSAQTLYVFTLSLTPGSWRIVVTAAYDDGTTSVATVDVVVVANYAGAYPGQVVLNEVVPNQATTRFTVRGDSPRVTANPADTVRLYGENLHDNPFLEVYLVRIGSEDSDPGLDPSGGYATGSWCYFPERNGVDVGDPNDPNDDHGPGAAIIDRGQDANGSYIDVRMPTMDGATRGSCDPGAAAFHDFGPPYSVDRRGIYTNIRYRWLVVDRWPGSPPARQHVMTALPDPYDPPTQRPPYFRVTRPLFPYADGFGFDNEGEAPDFDEFLAVYESSAYVCVGALGFCVTYAPDPVYWALWYWPYYFFIKESGGSCNGMSATARQFAQGELAVADFDPEAHMVHGLENDGYLALWDYPSFCNPLCDWPRPKNLWSHIRRNHGTQFSRQAVETVLAHTAEAVLDGSVADAALARLDSDVNDYVSCFTNLGGGHCVLPYAVQNQTDRDRILIYDNNDPGEGQNDGRYIDVVQECFPLGDDEICSGEYDYAERRSEGRDPNGGKFLISYPMSQFNDGVSLFGATDIAKLKLLHGFVFGSAEATIETDDGGTWGWDDQGELVNTIAGAITVSPLGHPDDLISRQLPVMIPLERGEPRVTVESLGGEYFVHLADNGHIAQLQKTGAQSGEQDVVEVGYDGSGRLRGFRFLPESASDDFVPKLGLELGEQESVVFEWLGLSMPDGESVAFSADRVARAVTFENDTTTTSGHLVVLHYAEGVTPGGAFGRMVYGPLELPAGGVQRLVLEAWPAVDTITVELDLDRDGTYEKRETVAGREAGWGANPFEETDLHVTKSVGPDSVSFGEAVEYVVTVRNDGPAQATDVRLIDTLPEHATLEWVETIRGQCWGRLECSLGTLLVGERVEVRYSVRAGRPGTLFNGAVVLAAERDSSFANNAAFEQSEVIPLADGEMCMSSTDCASTFCADGVCCNAACDSGLERCNLDARVGQCVQVAAAAPAMSPHGLAGALVVLILAGSLSIARRRLTDCS